MITHWALALVKGNREPHEAKKNSFDLGEKVRATYGPKFLMFFGISCDYMYLNIFVRKWRVILPILQETRAEQTYCVV